MPASAPTARPSPRSCSYVRRAASRFNLKQSAGTRTNVGTASYAGPLLEDFAAGDTIDLKGIVATGLNHSTSSGDLQLTGSGGSALATLASSVPAPSTSPPTARSGPCSRIAKPVQRLFAVATAAAKRWPRLDVATTSARRRFQDCWHKRMIRDGATAVAPAPLCWRQRSAHDSAAGNRRYGAVKPLGRKCKWRHFVAFTARSRPLLA
jgi:hypothetical protein